MSSKLEDQRAGYCRHCGDRLPLIKRVKREEFCSEDHRELFLSSTQIVALDRLRETDYQMQAAPQMEPEADHNSVVAVAEMAVDTTPEPPDPPMAGTIGPRAVDRPLLLVALFDGDGHSMGGQWEPVRPEPQWHGIALRFGLAEFHESSPEPIGEETELLRVIADPALADSPAELALPRNVSQLVPDLSPEETLELFSGDEDGEDQAPAPVATFLTLIAPAIHPMAAHRMAPMAEALELDTMLYLPAFSPQAEQESLGDRGWALAEWMASSGPLEAHKIAGRMEAIEAGEPLQAEIPIEPLLESRCRIEPAELPSEPEAEPETEAEPEPDLPAFVTASNDFDEYTLDEYALEGPTMATTGRQADDPAPAQIDWEERGMSEAVQNRTDPGSLAGLQALGERIANPFLHEPQPRPGSGTPRWTPATAELGTGAPLASEDWDIL